MALWDQADLVTVPLLDGGLGLLQIVDRAGPDAALAALTLRRPAPGAAVAPLAASDITSFQRIATGAIVDGTWTIAGFEQIPRRAALPDLDVARLRDWPGLPLRDPAVIEAFLNACHGLYPWDGFPDAAFFDTFLLPGRTRPDAAVLGR